MSSTVGAGTKAILVIILASTVLVIFQTKCLTTYVEAGTVDILGFPQSFQDGDLLVSATLHSSSLNILFLR